MLGSGECTTAATHGRGSGAYRNFQGAAMPYGRAAMCATGVRRNPWLCSAPIALGALMVPEPTAYVKYLALASAKDYYLSQPIETTLLQAIPTETPQTHYGNAPPLLLQIP